MNYSDSIKAILLAAINDLSKTPEKYAVKPGVDFIRNRKLGFKDYMLMFLTMEADCIREDIVFLDVLSMHLPKRLFTDSVKRSGKMLFGIFFLLLTGNFLKNYITVNMNSGPVMVLPVIFFLTLKIRIPILNQMVNLPEDLTRSISMLCFLYLISVLLIF